ncbi:uncharacterized protein [Solanum lycopersicum]|uniref:uncharacterized protein n=1 Tax=Solanum lycopersicum TaxID=4081 RepID=UPI003749296F
MSSERRTKTTSEPHSLAEAPISEQLGDQVVSSGYSSNTKIAPSVGTGFPCIARRLLFKSCGLVFAECVSCEIGEVYIFMDASNGKVVNFCDLENDDNVTSVGWTQRGIHLVVGTSNGKVQEKYEENITGKNVSI